MRASAFRNLLVVLGVLLLGTWEAAAAACAAQPANADGTTITSPTPNQSVSSPFTVRGQYFGSFEGVVPIQVLDSAGNALVETQANNECCVLAPYETQVTVRVSAPTEACIVVFRESGATGALTPLAQVPVTLLPAGLPGTGAATVLPRLLGLACLVLAAGLTLRARRLRIYSISRGG